MSNYSPATRAALAVFVLVTVLLVATTALVLSDRSQAAEFEAKQKLKAVSTSVAALVDRDGLGLSEGTNARLANVAEENGLAGIAILHRRGRLLAASDPTGLQQINWSMVVSRPGNALPMPTATWDGEEFFLVINTAVTGEHVAVLKAARDVHTASRGEALRIVAGALVLWFLIGVFLTALATYAGKRTGHRMEELVNRLAGIKRFDDESARQHVATARNSLGPLANPFDAVVDVLEQNYGSYVEARSQIAALFQINPHYVLLCTLDGHIVDANPAFYAMTGLPFDAVRGQRIEALNEVMPVEPLFELARRSLRENTSISGIEYALINRDDVRRAVQVSLRAVSIDEKPGVLIQATDVANQRNLERQISTFSDALDLMVDQRVAQLTAGNTSVSRLLDDAGVVLASFDSGGGTRRWNHATEDLTGRSVQQVPHFIAFLSVLDLTGVEKEQFNAWFWGSSEASFIMDVRTLEGLVRRMLWRKSVAGADGSAERRVLLGMDLPRFASHSGDGLGNVVPGLSASGAVA